MNLSAALMQVAMRILASSPLPATLPQRRAQLRKRMRQMQRAATERGVSVSCAGRGCSGCCRAGVPVGSAEFEALLPHVPASAWDRIAASRDALLDEQQVRMHPCPLLSPEDGSCSVYHHRPLMCMAYHSLSPAQWCWPERAGPRDLMQVAEPMAWVLALHTADLKRGERIEMLGRWLGERAV